VVSDRFKLWKWSAVMKVENFFKLF
jgi:hypothetical protein